MTDERGYAPTSFDLHRRCPRRRAFRRWARLPKVKTPALNFGIELHEHAERWLLKGAPPEAHSPAADLFLHGIPFLPEPGTAAVETEVATTLDGTRLYAFVDWVAPDPPPTFLANVQAQPECAVWFGDHKSSSDPKKWGLTTETLPTDPQAVIEAQGLLEKLDLEEIPGRWLYYHKKAPTRTSPVDVLFRRESNQVHLQMLIPTLDELREIDHILGREVNDGRVSTETINRLVPNDTAACESCGRNCDYAEHCNLFTQGEINLETIQQKIARMKAEAAARQAGGTPAPTGVSAPPEAAKALEQTQAEVAGTAAPAAPIAAPAPVAAPAPTPIAGPLEAPKKRGRPQGSKNVAPVATDAAPTGEQGSIISRLLAGEEVSLSIRLS